MPTLHREKSRGSDTQLSDYSQQSTIDERKLLWKIDLHVVPWLAILYLLNFLDRGSIGNAKVSTVNQRRIYQIFDFFSIVIQPRDRYWDY
jgi:hypothetical protein